MGRPIMTFEAFTKRARDRFGDVYDYSKGTWAGYYEPVLIICLKHGEFTQSPIGHLYARTGCPRCGVEQRSEKARLTRDTFITAARAIHGDRYDYSKVDYRGRHKKVAISCPIHGGYEVTPGNHLNLKEPCGCRSCGVKQAAIKRSLGNDKFVEMAQARHPGLYDYSKFVYVNNHTKGFITCQKHGDFLQTPNAHLNGNGCPKCTESRGERAIRLHLESKGVLFRQEHRVRGVGRFDFVARRGSPVIIEYHGKQHYQPCAFGSKRLYARFKLLIDTLRRDQRKENWCKAKSVPFLVIPFWDYDRISEILDAFLAEKEPVISVPPGRVRKYEPMRQRILEHLGVAS